jgi:hypothetical protein
VFISAISGSTDFCLIAICRLFLSNGRRTSFADVEIVFSCGAYFRVAGARAAGTAIPACSGQ